MNIMPQNKTVIQEDKTLTFFQDGDIVGKVDYSNKSQHYIDDAITNWLDDILSVETIEKYSFWNSVKN